MASNRLSRFFQLLLLLALSASACRDSYDDGPDVVFTGKPEFSIDLFEQRDPTDGTPVFGLWVESIEAYACAGYQLESAVTVTAASVEIALAARRPEPCTGTPEKIRHFVPIGNLSPGSYSFRLAIGNALFSDGTLEVTAQGYSLSLDTEQGVDFQNRLLSRIPAGLIWGYVLAPDELHQPVANQFISDLKSLTEEPGLAPGFYGYFTVTGTQSVYLHRSWQPGSLSTPFVLRLTADADALRAMLQGYRATPDALTIKCLSTVGEF